MALGATRLNRPTSKGALDADGKAQKDNPNGDWDRFGAWFDRTAFCAKELAKFQSPQIKAVDIPTAPPEIGLKQDEDFTINVFDSGIKVLEYTPGRDAA
jgi:hypothetical protein